MWFDKNGELKFGGQNNKVLDVIMAPKRIALCDCINTFDKLGVNGMAVTITFTDRLLFTYTEDCLCQQVKKVIGHTRYIGEYMLIKDVSNTGRFHLHGVIQFKKLTAVMNLRRKLNKEFGVNKVKKIDNVSKWSHYCTDQYTEEGKHDVIIKHKHCKVITNVIS